ncbi:hypothetical protein [Rhizobium mesosinicum]|uniref:Uncharacterized protein n=1 Tax=Rhizobium mesosinicum TaxID=335017 RepID=A0ABS7GQW7_9HYPH|nr:hypothetical protein [Rhizobium mesosinicum]MBW9052308.1 hypothetical protein [Rhizobium mesosinicum]
MRGARLDVNYPACNLAQHAGQKMGWSEIVYQLPDGGEDYHDSNANTRGFD